MAEKTSNALLDNIFEFKSIKPNESLDLNSKSKIFLVINGKETEIPIEKLFLKTKETPELDEEDIRGYSILQLVKNNELKIDDSTILNISLIDKTTGKQFNISKVRRPVFPGYADDIEIPAEKRLEYVDLLLTAIASTSEPSANTAILEPASAPVVDAIQEPEPIKEPEPILGGPEWEGTRQDLIDRGYTEYENGNYRFFHKKEGDEVPELAFFILELGDFFNIELFDEEEITEESEKYSYEDQDNVEWTVTFNKKEGKVSIEEAKVNS